MVIGAGPAALISLDCLIKEECFGTIRVFERKSEAGGSWIYLKDPPEDLPPLKHLSDRKVFTNQQTPPILPCYVQKSYFPRFMDTAIYPYLETNVVDKIMEFTQEPFPTEQTSLSISKFGKNTPYRHHEQVKFYIQNLYKNQQYDDYITFNTSVENCIKLNNKWLVTLRKFGKKIDYIWQESFDYIIVATGKYIIPYIPYVPGLQQFHDNNYGSIIHSKSYRSKNYYKNKKVIVVGASISAMDLLHDIIPITNCKVISSKKSNTKLLPIFGSAPFDHPNIDNRGKIIKIEKKKVFFDDNTLAIVDSIIYGTGYSFSFPMFSFLNLKNNRIHGLYQNISYIDDPSLAFIGCVAGGLTFKVFEWQAAFAARIFSGRANLPSKIDQYNWEINRIKLKGDSEKFVWIQDEWEQYFEDLRKLATNNGPGRKLPPFDKNWINLIYSGYNRKMRFFIENNHKVEKSENDSKL